MIVAAPDEEVDGGGSRRCNLDLGGGIRSPSLSAAVAASTTAILNGERRDSESSRGGGTARAAADGKDLPGPSAAIGGSGGNDDGRQGWTLTGKGREPARQRRQAKGR
jgi:hypothetical protein